MTATDPTAPPSAAPSAAGSVPRSSARIPVRRLLDVELRKTVDTRASAALLAGVAGVAALVVGALAVWGREDELGLAYLARSVAYPLQLVVPMVAALAVTGEWTQRGALATFALVPRRGRVVGAKAAAGLVVAVGASLLSFALSALGTAAASAARGIDPVWDLSLDAAARLTLLLVLATAVGFALAVAIRASAPTLVAS
ncbi:ABC transporter permease [Isoptericola sp. NPDC057391]|uniref:ABC transporter permease n=1 Tax=Isoptericola sp. NPDC057391 TaxID=3346117 RepID=UPI003637E51B